MKKAFTLIELMVVIAIFAILCATVCAIKFERGSNEGNPGKTEIQRQGKAETPTYTFKVISD